MQSITDKEAWKLFRIGALSEAASWLLLLIGMLFKYVITPGNDTLVAIGGSIHGTVFLGYLAALIGLYRILRLTLTQAGLALISSIIPFGTLVFVRWLAKRRQEEAVSSYRQTVVRGIIPMQKKLLLVRSKDVGFWCPPGGVVTVDETASQSLIRTILHQTGISPTVGKLLYILEYQHNSVARLELFFQIDNPKDFLAVPHLVTEETSIELDRVAFIDPAEEDSLQPSFLKETAVSTDQILFFK